MAILGSTESVYYFAVVCPWGIQYVGLEIFTEGMLEDDDD
jgi:hypothetical protein